LHHFPLQKIGGVIGIIIADPGAFIGLRVPFFDGFSHFCGHQPGVFFCVVAKYLSRLFHLLRPLRKTGFLPV
jgi:hypothetical protein